MTDREKIRAEVERLKEIHEKLLNKPMERGRIGHAHGYVDCCDEILDFIDSLPEEMESVDGVVSHFSGVDQAAIRYTDPSGIFMSYYAKRGDLQVGDKVKIIITKEG